VGAEWVESGCRAVGEGIYRGCINMITPARKIHWHTGRHGVEEKHGGMQKKRAA